MAREKDVDFARKGNWKSAPGSAKADRKPVAKARTAPPKPRSKPAAPAKVARSTPPKPKPKPVMAKSDAAPKAGKMATRVGASSGKASGSGPAFVKGGGSTTISKTPAKAKAVSNSGATKGDVGKKIDDGVMARMARGAKRLMGSKNTSPKGYRTPQGRDRDEAARKKKSDSYKADLAAIPSLKK